MVTDIILGLALLAAIGGLIYFAKAALDLANARDVAITDRDAITIADANRATATVDAALKDAQARSNAQEQQEHDRLAGVAGGGGSGDPLQTSATTHPAGNGGGGSAGGVSALPAGGSAGPRAPR